MNPDLDEKEMIGDLLDDYGMVFQQIDLDKKCQKQSRTPQVVVHVPAQHGHVQYGRVYSPQISMKTNSYDLDLKLTKIPTQQSAPTSALKARSFDQLSHFIPEKIEDMSLEGDLINKCKDQNGARNIQRLFEEGLPEKRDAIFSKLEKGILILSKDVFGNYVVQNLLENGSPTQQQKLLLILQPHTLPLAYHTYGCRVLQKLFEIAHRDIKEFNCLFDQIKKEVRELVVDQHGNHVVQRIIQLCGEEMSLWVIEGVEGQIDRLTSNSFGCRIIQKAITISKQNRLTKIYEELMVNCSKLCISQYGNYIIQQLIKDGPFKILEQIQNNILDNFEDFSFNKFGSNVVDCAVQYSNKDFKRKVMELMVQQRNNQVLFVRLSKNAYGNYVVQNFLKSVDNELQRELYFKITNNAALLHDIQQSQFGQYVYQTLNQKQELETFKL